MLEFLIQAVDDVTMDQRFLEKSCRYSIRKLTVGTASVLLGAIFLASHQVGADSIVGSQNESNHLEAAPAIESPTDGAGEPNQKIRISLLFLKKKARHLVQKFKASILPLRPLQLSQMKKGKL